MIRWEPCKFLEHCIHCKGRNKVSPVWSLWYHSILRSSQYHLIYIVSHIIIIIESVTWLGGVTPGPLVNSNFLIVWTHPGNQNYHTGPPWKIFWIWAKFNIHVHVILCNTMLHDLYNNKNVMCIQERVTLYTSLVYLN